MIMVDGFLAFHGSIRVVPALPSLPTFTISGDCLFRPDTNCWYVQPTRGLCRSFPADICEILPNSSERS